MFKIHPKEMRYMAIMSIIGCIFYGSLLFTFIITPPQVMALIAFYVVVVVAFLSLAQLLFVGSLKGNSVKITKYQFPEIYEILQSQSKLLELQKVPDMYLLQSNGILNAFALRFANRNYVVICSDVMEMAYQEGIDAVAFIIGHELGHIKRKHTNFFKNIFLLPAKFIPFLANAYSRACEYTCDNIGYSLSREGSVKGILLLAAGKKLYTKVNVKDLIKTAKSENGFSVKLAEKFSTHPYLIKRIESLQNLDQDNLADKLSFFTSSSIYSQDRAEN